MYQKLILKISTPEFWYQALAVSQLELKLLCIHVKQERKRNHVLCIILDQQNDGNVLLVNQSYHACVQYCLLASPSPFP